VEIKPALFGDLLARKISHSEGEIRQREYIRQKFDLIWLAAFNLRVPTEQFSYDSCAASSRASRKNGRKRVIHARKISCSRVGTKDLNVAPSKNADIAFESLQAHQNFSLNLYSPNFTPAIYGV